MSTPPVADDPHPQTTSSPPLLHTPESLRYSVTHVFLPVDPPDKTDYTRENCYSLARAVCAAAHAYATYVDGSTEQAQWHRINLEVYVQLEHVETGHVISQLRGMETEDVLVYFIQDQDVAILLTRRENCTLCEAFEVSPSEDDDVWNTPGSLIRSYPGSAIEIPNDMFDDVDFQSELAKFVSLGKFSYPHATTLPSPAAPHFINAVLNNVLQHVGHTTCIPCLSKPVVVVSGILRGIAGVCHVTKHVRDHIGASDKDFWHRSPLWLFIRVAIQMSDNPALGRSSYKSFILFFILREILDARWKQLSIHQSPFQNPSQDVLTHDTQLSLLNSGEYIRNALKNHDHESAYKTNPVTALYDVERSVEEGIDDWVASITNVDNVCAQLMVLMKNYTGKDDKSINPEHTSIRFLTVIELYVAHDKLAVKEVPMLADYPPLISIDPERLCLRKTTSLDRLSCTVQYFSARNSQSCWKMSVLSNEFTTDSFPVHYYDQSPRLQQLKARIEEDAMKNATASDVQHGSSSLPCAHVVGFKLQCPTCIRIWCSAVPHNIQGVLKYSIGISQFSNVSGLFAGVPALERYHQGTPNLFQINLGYVYPILLTDVELWNGPELRYGRRGQNIVLDFWKSSTESRTFRYDFEDHCPSCRTMEEYVYSTSHTSNDIMSAQANCHADLSLDEFIAFAHLRSGGSLQWLNILYRIRTRTLNLCRHQVHFLLFRAVSQLRPFDLNTGAWIWHQELQEPSFCTTLLDELENLLMEVGASSMDSMLMNTISLLLTRVLVSSPSKDISEQAIMLIRSVRKKTSSAN
ncbi:hypothetical protein V8E55_008109 [Tylopilus felleus]